MFRALQIADATAILRDDVTDDELGDGDVIIDVDYSS
ncbi:MAG: hypothetical protein JWO18_1245, partial [Microbacteriaceae bacterium]|nr:hypothetical protein [Microbacteriaceae bacterium]